MGVDSCVCVTNIPTDATESELYSHFSSVFNIEAVLMENNPKTNTFSGTAFIVYEEMTSAADAPVKLDIVRQPKVKFSNNLVLGS